MIVPFILSIAINLPQVYNTFIEDRHHVIDPWSTTACRPASGSATTSFDFTIVAITLTPFLLHLSVALPGRL